MINQDRWINSLPKIKKKNNEETAQVDHYRWISTISKKNSYNIIKKYSTMVVLFVCGLLFVSMVKNETRNLEKKINNLRTTNNVIQFDLDQATLDHEVITSPGNISRLAKEYLNNSLLFYKKSQIKNLGEDTTTIIKTSKKNNKISAGIKSEIIRRIDEKKTQIRKLQSLYSKPETIPGEIKTQVAIKIEKKKVGLKKLYTSPKEIITSGKAQKWAAIQVVKVFLGMPIIPGR